MDTKPSDPGGDNGQEVTALDKPAPLQDSQTELAPSETTSTTATKGPF